MVIFTYNFHVTCPKSQHMVDFNQIYGAYYIHVMVHLTIVMQPQWNFMNDVAFYLVILCIFVEYLECNCTLIKLQQKVSLYAK
jgi:hypothetical protein